MDNNNFNYILETNGKDNKQQRDRDGNFIPHVSFNETGYFNTLQEAVESLLLIDIRQFEEMTDEAGKNKYYEYARIVDQKENESLLEIIRIPFSDSPDGSPPAGIYMHFVDNTTKDFEEISGYRFTGFNRYDPESPFLLLASYSYGQGFQITVDSALSDWRNSLQFYEMAREFNEKEWKYKVHTVKDILNKPPKQELTSYHFHDFPEAFYRLLHTDITDMDRDIAQSSGKENWISKARLELREVGPFIGFINAKDQAGPDVVPEPGVHLKSYQQPISEIESDYNVDLSPLGNYGQNDQYLVVANYNKDLTQLLPHPGYLEILSRSSKPQSPYNLQVVWENTHESNKDTAFSKDQRIQNTDCSSLQEALSTMKQLDDRFFDEQQAMKWHYPLYIKQADIINTNNNTVVASKFQVSHPGEHLPRGVYMKLDEDHVSVEMLKLLQSHIKEATHVHSLHFLVAGIKAEELSIQAESLQRKRIANQRTISPPDNNGPKL